MGVFEGGLLMTVLFFTIIGFLAMGGALEKSPYAYQYLANVPNDGNISNYYDQNLAHTSFGSSNGSGVNISTTQGENNPAGSCSSSGILDCADAFGRLQFYFSVIAKGWVLILEVLLAGTALSPLIYLIGIPLQILQVVFLVQILFLIISIFKGGTTKL